MIDVRKWKVNYKDKWLIVTKIGVDIKKYPAIFKHLSQWQSQLEQRQDQGEHWWELRACTYYSEFDRPKIVYPDIAKESRFAFDNTGMYFTNTTYFFPSDDLYLLGVLNSKVLWKYASEKLTVIGDASEGGRLRFFTQFVKDLPIPIPTPQQRVIIQLLVKYILFLIEQPFARSTDLAQANDRLMLNYFEQLLNGLVYELYFPDELHQAEKQFIQPLLAENLPSLDQIKGDKLAELRCIYARLFDKDHPLRRNLFFLDSLEIIRLIEGKV